ncbi:hypothetical protein MANES_05G150105v8 [Manihot esculenta]|uniref:Uncharacterized protein n=1 Tax=Manihot esculenta TaxID=3983 RepID=A0ACB7HQL6_MANES|nr:hypothetical protein MANES_05G150105v8 [Manihot esculenta]
MHRKQPRNGWTGHFRRHLRRPKAPSRDETRVGSAAGSAAETPGQKRNSAFGGTFGSRKTASHAGSAAETPFGGRTWSPLDDRSDSAKPKTKLKTPKSLHTLSQTCIKEHKLT